jgi:hypothetical protein
MNLANVVLYPRVFGRNCCMRIDISTAIHWLASKGQTLSEKVYRTCSYCFVRQFRLERQIHIQNQN